MNLSPINMAFIIVGAILFLFLRIRKKTRRTPMLQERQISVKGYKVVTALSSSTPLPCLLADGLNFGEDFKNKEEPELPHVEGCKCESVMIILRSREVFSGKDEDITARESDLGKLEGADARYYKYSLILHHQDLSPKDQATYTEVLQQIQVDETFKQKIKTLFQIRGISDTT